MNILMPIYKEKEITLLSRAGANEFYCGYVPKYWIEKYNKSLYKDGEYRQMQVSNNKRDSIKDNITEYSVLQNVVKEAKDNGVKIFIALNYMFYPQEAYEDLEKIIDEIVPLNVDGLIITDVGLIYFIREKYPSINIILSTCQSVYNTQSASFFKKMGVKRITFPRHVTLNEVAEITNNVTDIEYELFVLTGKCIYDNGNCKTFHNMCHFCSEQWEYNYFHTDGSEFSYEELEKLYDNENEYRHWSRFYPSVKARINEWPEIGCSICALPALIKSGKITTLKVAGRGASLSGKILNVKLLKKVAEMVDAGCDTEEIREYMKKFFGISPMCDLKRRCYLVNGKN